MEDILVSDDELVYLIRQNNEEAKRLLFLRYETFKRKILEKTDYSLHRNLDDNAIDSIYYESIMEAISNYEYEKGYFFFFVKEVFEKKLIAYYRKYTYKSRNEILLKDYDEENVNFELDDSYTYQSDIVDFNLIVNYIKEEDPLSYSVLVMWLKGYRYNEIGKYLGIHEKKVYYLLNKSIKIAKSKIKNK